MIIRVYRTSATFTPSILHADLIAEVDTDEPPEDPEVFADDYGGDFLVFVPGEEHE